MTRLINQFADVLNMNELMTLSTYTNVEYVYSNYFTNIPFKLTGLETNTTTTATYFYAIKSMATINSFITIMKDIIKKDFNIDTFEIVINTEGENGHDINQSIIQVFGERNQEHIYVHEIINNNTGFYVRPIHQSQSSSPSQPPTEELSTISSTSINNNNNDNNDNNCPICYSVLDIIRMNYFTCRHHICLNCFNGWRVRNEDHTTCPLCRANLI